MILWWTHQCSRFLWSFLPIMGLISYATLLIPPYPAKSGGCLPQNLFFFFFPFSDIGKLSFSNVMRSSLITSGSWFFWNILLERQERNSLGRVILILQITVDPSQTHFILRHFHVTKDSVKWFFSPLPVCVCVCVFPCVCVYVCRNWVMLAGRSTAATTLNK